MKNFDWDGCGQMLYIVFLFVLIIVIVGIAMFGPCEFYGFMPITQVPSRCLTGR